MSEAKYRSSDGMTVAKPPHREAMWVIPKEWSRQPKADPVLDPFLKGSVEKYEKRWPKATPKRSFGRNTVAEGHPKAKLWTFNVELEARFEVGGGIIDEMKDINRPKAY